MINGLDEFEHKIYNSSIGAFVDRDYRGLKEVLQDLIDRKLIYLHSDGNLYHYKFAEENKLPSYRCDACSHVSHSEEEKRQHYFIHQARQRR